MAISPQDREFWPLLTKAVNARIEREVDGMLTGLPNDRYWRSIGYIDGLKFVQEEAARLTKEAKKEG